MEEARRRTSPLRGVSVAVKLSKCQPSACGCFAPSLRSRSKLGGFVDGADANGRPAHLFRRRTVDVRKLFFGSPRRGPTVKLRKISDRKNKNVFTGAEKSVTLLTAASPTGGTWHFFLGDSKPNGCVLMLNGAKYFVSRLPFSECAARIS